MQSVTSATAVATTARANDITLYASLELSKSKWVVTINNPGSEKFSKHVVEGGESPAPTSRRVCSMVRAPPTPRKTRRIRRRLTRERGTLLKERIQHTNQVQGPAQRPRRPGLRSASA